MKHSWGAGITQGSKCRQSATPRPPRRNTPGTLYTLATALLLAGPALVYFLPDDSTVLVALQFALALVCVLGGAAAYGGASLLASLQK